MPTSPAYLFLLHRALNLLPQQTTVHQRNKTVLPLAAVQIAADNFVQAELFARVGMPAATLQGCAPRPPLGRVVGTGFAEVSERKRKKVNALLAAPGCQSIPTAISEPPIVRFLTLFLGKGDFPVRDYPVRGMTSCSLFFAHQNTRQLLAVLGLQHKGVVTFLDFAVRIIINKTATRPDNPAGALAPIESQVRPHFFRRRRRSRGK